MGCKIHILIIAMVMLMAPASAYQQAYLIFELPGWDIYEQNSASQQFVKGNDLYLDIKASQSQLVGTEEFALSIEGKIESTGKIGDIEEAVIANKEVFFIFSRYPYKDHTYLLTMYGPISRLAEGKSEMQKLYATLDFAATPSVVEAPYEKELVPPEGLSFFTTHPIPWDWVILIAILAGIGYLIYRRKSRKRKQKEEKGEEHKRQKD